MTPSRLANQNGDKDWEGGSTGTSPAPEYTGTVVNSPISLESISKMFQTLHFGLHEQNVPVFAFVGPKLFKEPSFKSNKFIIHNALTRCCLAGRVNEAQKNKIVEVVEIKLEFML